MAGKQEIFAPTVGDSLLGVCAQEKDDAVASTLDKESNLGCRDVSSCTLSFLGNDLPQVRPWEPPLEDSIIITFAYTYFPFKDARQEIRSTEQHI